MDRADKTYIRALARAKYGKDWHSSPERSTMFQTATDIFQKGHATIGAWYTFDAEQFLQDFDTVPAELDDTDHYKPSYPHAVLCNAKIHPQFAVEGFVMINCEHEFCYCGGVEVYHDFKSLLGCSLQHHCNVVHTEDGGTMDGPGGSWAMKPLTLFVERDTWAHLNQTQRADICEMVCPCCDRAVKKVYTHCHWPGAPNPSKQ